MIAPIPFTRWQAFVAASWSWSLSGRRVIQVGVEPRNEDHYHDMASLSLGRWFGFGVEETYYDGPWSWLNLGVVSVFFGGRPLPNCLNRLRRGKP